MAEENTNTRLEAFCDGVFGIALTLLIIDVKLPPEEIINTTADFWRALAHTLPTIGTFLFSFAVILITWVNHHGTLKLVNKSTPAFMYANGLMLLSVVLIPFPTTLMGEHLFTDHGAPAVILYSAILVIQAVAWYLMSHTALHPNSLAKNEQGRIEIQNRQKFSYFGIVTYSVCALTATWYPLSVAGFMSALWLVWLVKSITSKTS